MALTLEMHVQQLLKTHNYNSVGNFIRFYEEFKHSKEASLQQFMLTYKPPITSEHHTCVGLGLTLLDELKTLEERFPGIASSLYMASCEELIEDVDTCVQTYPDPFKVQKEHVLVALKVEIAGRKGLLLLDPGYHVARVVTVMEDQSYPHTGWFTQSKEDICRKDYNYTFSGDLNYVVWHLREQRGSLPEKLTSSVVYVARPFLNPVDVTERRNLVYNFRSLLSRDLKGQLTSGIFFSVTNNSLPSQFSIFYQHNNVKKKGKFSFSDFKSAENVPDDNVHVMIKESNKLLGFPPGQLLDTLEKLAFVLSDLDFVDQMLCINSNINNIADND